jgi:hypothetical protein
LFSNVSDLAVLVPFTDWLANVIDVLDKLAGIIPVPLSCAVCGEFAASSLIVSDPVRTPSTVGVKVTEMLQVSFAANVLGARGQFEVCAKSPEVETTPMVKGTVSLFCKVSTLAALTPFTDWLPNTIDDADKLAGTIPVPLNCAVWGEFEASSVTVKVPVRAPSTAGVKVTETLQVNFAASVLGDRGQFEVCAKSPEVEMAAMVNGPDSLFCSVRILTGLVTFNAWLPNGRVDADKAAGITPAPFSCAFCGEFEASSLTVIVPVREPRAVGVKVIETTQLSFGANVFGDNGQVEVCAKSPEVEMPAMVSGTA